MEANFGSSTILPDAVVAAVLKDLDVSREQLQETLGIVEEATGKAGVLQDRIRRLAGALEILDPDLYHAREQEAKTIPPPRTAAFSEKDVLRR